MKADISRRRFLATGVAMGAACGGLFSEGLSESRLAKKPRRRGVSLSGAEFGVRPDFSNRNLGQFGKDYTYNSEKTVAYFARQGVKHLRVPFRWERMQPSLGGELDATELGRLREFVGWARKHDCRVILDPHNYGRYALEIDGKAKDCVIDESVEGHVRVTRDHFADFWLRLSAVFADEPAVEAYGLVNEPHDMGSSDWKAISQAAVDAIRSRGDGKWIFVPGESWSNSDRFREINGPKAWVRDPLGRTGYEAHCYFDHDYSGRYEKSYDEELKRDPELEQRGAKRIGQFVEWCQTNKVRGLLGEFGVPPDPRWLQVLRNFLQALDRAGLLGCYWAAGEWWGRYPLSIQPEGADKGQPQLEVLVAERDGH
ncbi:MAG TPA: glycoside hydrolase family 5 protein [Pirellulales bacterium]